MNSGAAMTMPDGGAKSGAQNWSAGARLSVKSWSLYKVLIKNASIGVL